MNFLDSECSSGCESGWTLYLEQSFLSPNASHKPSGFQAKSGNNFCDNNNIIGHDKEKGFEEEEEEEEEEDLSMISDASSGPPLLQHDFHHEADDNELVHLNHDHYNNKLSKSSGKKRQNNMKDKQQQQQPSFLDDTASSPLFNFSNNMEKDFALTNMNQGSSMESVLDYSQGFSATHFQGRSPAFQDPFGPFLHSPLSGNQLHEKSGLKGIRRWK